MGLKLEIGLERLREPGVAAALASFFEAMGGVSASIPAARPAVKAPVALPAPVATAKKPTAPKKSTPLVAKPALVDAPGSDFDAFLAKLPERSRKFIELVQQHGTLRIGAAMKALDVTAPKAMGGLTGSIGRWAPIRGVKVPYVAITVDGERAWRWTQPSVDGVVPPMPPADPPKRRGRPPKPKPVVDVAVAPKRRGRPPKPKPVVDVAPKRRGRPPKPKPAVDVAVTPKRRGRPPKAKPAPVKTSSAALSIPAIEAIAEALPKGSIKFLQLLAERGVVPMKVVLKELGLPRPRALGGLTEPIMRACRDLEVAPAFLRGKDADGRVFLWPGVDVPGDVRLD